MCPLFVSLAQMLLIAAPVDENVEWKFGNMWYNNLSFIISSLDVKDMECYIKMSLSIDCSSMKSQDVILWYYYLGRLTSFADELSYLVGLLNYYVGKVFSHGFDFVAAEKVVNLLRRVMTTEHIMWDTYKYHIKDRLENGVSEFHPESI